MTIPSPAYWYISSVGWSAVAAWAANTAYAAGAMVRQNAAPTVGNERVFIAVVGGTSHATTEPTWGITKGAKTSDNTVTWQECTGQAAVNGSLPYTSGWTAGPGGVGTGVKNQAVALGYIIHRDNGASYQICTTAGTAGNGAEPSFSNAAGTTTADNTVTWTSLGAIGNFTTAFGAPHARLFNAKTATWGAAGDIFFAADNSAETQATTNTIPSTGTVNAPSFIYSVDHTKTSPGTGDVIAGASVSTTGNTSVNFTVSFDFYQGLIFNSGTGANNVAPTIGAGGSHELIFDTCQHNIVATGASAVLTVGSAAAAGGKIIFQNGTTVGIGAAGQTIANKSQNFIWRNTLSALTGTAQTNVFNTTNSLTCQMDVIGVDFSNAGANTIVASHPGCAFRFTFSDCKIAASAVRGVTPDVRGGRLDFIRCDSGATNYFQARYWYEGTLTQETTIVRTGGASDGTTPLSWKLVSTANSKWVMPFESFPIAIWNDTVGSAVTATVEIVAAGALNNDDVWAEVEYLGSASTPQASFVNSTKANNLAAGTALAASAAVWASSPGSPQKLSVTFTPQMRGQVILRVFVAKPSQTVYVDPRPSFNGVPVRRSYISINGVFMAEPAVSRPGLHSIDMGIAA